jgi:hypothetical protein
MANYEPGPWLTMDLRLTEAEVAAIAARGAVTGKIACRILEAVAEECDEAVRAIHGSMRRKFRRRAS